MCTAWVAIQYILVYYVISVSYYKAWVLALPTVVRLMLASEEHYSLLLNGVIISKKFYNIGPGMTLKKGIKS